MLSFKLSDPLVLSETQLLEAPKDTTSVSQYLEGLGTPFALYESLAAQQQRLKALEEDDPITLQDCMNTGVALIDAAKRGDLHELQRVVKNAYKGELLFWHISKAFHAACAGMHLTTVQFMVEGGLDLTQSTFDDSIHRIIEAKTIGLNNSDEDARAIISYLVSKKMDINQPRKDDWWTCLHVAANARHLSSVRLLVDLGADVNAVAKNDRMPLTTVMHSDEAAAKEVETYLREKGAKESWRTVEQKPTNELTVTSTVSVQPAGERNGVQYSTFSFSA
eukprot:GILK01001366.1.p1 GENE.GILK01001366.1~~GILK01001366.1.p1  ORF type:complete len:278 (-),score=56.96 GILK01001366.1:80-913(-)